MPGMPPGAGMPPMGNPAAMQQMMQQMMGGAGGGGGGGMPDMSKMMANMFGGGQR